MINTYTIIIILIFIVFLLYKKKIIESDAYLYLCSFLFGIIIVLRDPLSIGVDSVDIYNRFYNEYSNVPLNYIFQKNNSNYAFYILIKIIGGILHLKYYHFTSIIALFVLCCLIRILKKYSVNYFESFLLLLGFLFVFYYLSALKQSIAMSFILLSYEGIVKKKILYFILMCLIASLFHFPALVFLPAYYIANQRNLKFYLFELICLFIIVYVFRNYILDIMIDVYSTMIYESEMRFLSNKVLLILFIILSGLYLNFMQPPKLFYNLINLIGIAAILQTFCLYNNTFERLSDYYFQFIILFLPIAYNEKNFVTNDNRFTYNHFQVKNGIIIFKILLYSLLILRFCFYINKSSNYLPFKTWLIN